MKVIDLRSDTVTKPTEKMRMAMFSAEVGDDVLGDDPTVKKLERLSAEIFGKESALFFPSGSMANATAVKVHTNEGDEVIVEEKSHIYLMEMGYLAFISRVIPRPVRSSRGNLDIEEVKKTIRFSRAYNYWGGAVVDIENLREIYLDGARLFNASVYSGTKFAHSVMFSLSKGLSAPIGSVLVGDAEFIEKARRIRKLLGGGMRQVGVIAAAGIIALTEMVDRLEEDHRKARIFAEGLGLDPKLFPTNIVILEVEDAQEFIYKLKERGVLALAIRVCKDGTNIWVRG
ncbi:beta-eliminating lyase-related protein [Candidatus Caldipriscus sp.]|nr:beta-eliminating lyase-related protein [Candidatus Caldipriscus sp.]